VIFRSLLSASDAPWQTGDLKEIHSHCGKNHFRKNGYGYEKFQITLWTYLYES